MSGSDSGAPRNVLTPQARTAATGFALVNGTPNIITWTTPNDGQMHQAITSGTLIVSSALTGGAVIVRYTAGGVAQAAQLMAGNAAANVSGQQTVTADPNTTVTIAQQTAATAGAATLYAAISGG
jgi:hypothetical protein